MPPGPPSLAALRQYATLPNPGTLPPSVLFSHTDQTLTVFDTFPKSIFHVLVLPRVPALGTVEQLDSLKALLKDKGRAQTVLDALTTAAEDAKSSILEEMQSRYGFEWGVRCGFHAVPSMLHLHLHVMSDDLVSDRLKHKKHYNSFHPKLGFWLPLEDVKEWLESTDEYYQRMAKLPKEQYEPLLKSELRCFHCDREMKTVPALKAHLQEEWDAVEKRSVRKGKKRKVDASEPEPEGEPAAKRQLASPTDEPS